jgi:hypothetical protein
MKQERAPKNIDQKTSRNIKIIVVTIFIVLVATITTSMVIRGMDIGQDIAEPVQTSQPGVARNPVA